MLSRLIYASKAKPDLELPEIRRMMESSIRHNKKNGITGLLMLSGGCFLQVLEGNQALVSATYGRIVQDPRHHEAVLIEVCEIAERFFADWTMRLVTLDALLAPDAIPVGFNPLKLSGGSALHLLRALSMTTTA